VQKAAETQGVELSAATIKTLYEQSLVSVSAQWQLNDYELHTESNQVSAHFTIGGTRFVGKGAGALEALCDALAKQYQCEIEVSHFDEHAIGAGTDAQALASICVAINGAVEYAVATNEDTSAAALQAMLTAFSRQEMKTVPSVQGTEQVA
jgi:2-isopropylmalate synthase